MMTDKLNLIKTVVEFQTSNKSEPRGQNSENLSVCIFISKNNSFCRGIRHASGGGSIVSDDLLEVLDVNSFNERLDIVASACPC